MRFLELRLPPVAVVLIFAALMSALAYAIPAAILIPAATWVAVALALSGGLVALLGVLAFRRQQTTVNPLTPEQSSSLVATGIYRYSRNPMYLGFLLALIGWCVYLANWACFLLLPAFVAYLNTFQIEPEEKALAEKFADSFTDYTRTVRRWL